MGTDLITLGLGVVLAVAWGIGFRDFVRQLDQRWTYVAGLQRGFLEWWAALRTPLTEPALERQRRVLVIVLAMVGFQCAIGSALLAVDMRLFG